MTTNTNPTSNPRPTDATSVDVEAVLHERVAALTLEQKVQLLTGADAWSLHPEPDAGLRRLVVSDGPAGVRGETWDERDPSANVPSPTALAATWDPERLERLGRLLATEARRKGVDVLLAPTVNLHRSPYGGRHFECFSEDPWLTATIGTAYVRGVQAGGVGATVKHFVANDSETERLTLDARVDERTLRELYLAPFEDIVRDAHPWAIMAAYNGVNGHTMTESPLQRDVLKGEWAWDGLIVSDWFATRSIAAAGDGLLDLAMPGPASPWSDGLVDAVKAGEVPEPALDDKVLRLLRLAARVGALDGVAHTPTVDSVLTDTEIRAELRAAASAGFVLTRNEGGVLPIDPGATSRIAVLGPNARVARTLGGGSATVLPSYTVSPLEGLRTAVGEDVEILHGDGVRSSERVRAASAAQLTLPDGTGPGVEVRYLDAGGEALLVEHRTSSTLLWMGRVSDGLAIGDVAAIELHTRFRPEADGHHQLGGAGVGRFELSVDGDEVLDAEAALAPGSDIVEGFMKPPQVVAELELTVGVEVDVGVRFTPAAFGGDFANADVGMALCHLLADVVIDDDVAIAEAVELARTADVAVLVVGTTEEVESEGFDRDSLALPGRQDELVRRVAAVNPRTVVVVNAGAPVLLPWADEVASVLLTWFPGQEFGNALADVLLGAVEPGGRLPTTWPLDEQGHPSVTPVDGVLPYDEGLAIGYRRTERDGSPVRYAFGHGLGYTSWSYTNLEAPASTRADAAVTVRARVRNVGGLAGREVVQVYASRPDSAVERAPRWLVGSAVIEAAAGEEVEVEVTLGRRALAYWQPGAGWTVEPGTYQLHVGRSVADLRAGTRIAVTN
jgi:beta-glucosidase